MHPLLLIASMSVLSHIYNFPRKMVVVCVQICKKMNLRLCQVSMVMKFWFGMPTHLIKNRRDDGVNKKLGRAGLHFREKESSSNM